MTIETTTTETPATETQAAWYPDEYKGLVEAKGWASPADALSSYHSLEKMRGVPAERLVTLPEGATGDEALKAVAQARGLLPEAADKYTNKLGEGMTDVFYSAAAEKALALGLTDAQFGGMQEMLVGTVAQVKQAEAARVDAAFETWSSAHPDAVTQVKAMLTSVQADEASVAAALSGDKAALFDLLGKVAARGAERGLVAGDAADTSLSSAKAEIARLRADKEFMAQQTSSNAQVRRAADERLEQLYKIAYPGT